ncbi:MAG: Cupin 2 conserved barrel domain protein [Candidatus Amesbacteria bacterium GW2011_GWB1_47_19]|nr:MAG: Cupin 2 conserved barrel domain protein [Candidatus Amesbacteria bacterium GW2011_GWA1_44_24]KKU30865.1 MAG: Cupin 2 conserved barrel domain protein [Candidatus Amesbacteria bacterium GW2011_GWC1_46_24]KKU66554.1 MAG: Cupin 2 conserved barrel domain protein [Candidatus Amesbacteria bacterium GW2011_GWB1_47_19]
MAIVKNIKKQAKDNSFFRKVLETGKFTQVVIMSIPPGGEIGEEIHDDTDQVLCLAEGEGQVILEGEISEYAEHDLVLVPAGTKHNFVNNGKEDLKIITMYSPPHHPPGTVHKTKAEADKAEY